MDQTEAEYIIFNCSPNRKLNISPTTNKNQSRCPSPNSIALYPSSAKIIKYCKNCLYSFRSELRPNAEFCNKDCETSFFLFKKRCDQPYSPKTPERINYEPNRLSKSIPESKSLDKIIENTVASKGLPEISNPKLTRCHQSWIEHTPKQVNTTGFDKFVQIITKLF